MPAHAEPAVPGQRQQSPAREPGRTPPDAERTTAGQTSVGAASGTSVASAGVELFGSASLSALQKLTNSPLASSSSVPAPPSSSTTPKDTANSGDSTNILKKSEPVSVSPANSDANAKSSVSGNNKLVKDMEQMTVSIQELVNKVVDTKTEGESTVQSSRPILRSVLEQAEVTPKPIIGAKKVETKFTTPVKTEDKEDKDIVQTNSEAVGTDTGVAEEDKNKPDAETSASSK